MSTAVLPAGAETRRAPSPIAAPAAARPLLAVEGLTKRYGGLVAAKDIGLSIRPGEILGLIAQGHPNPSIARTLFLSPKTVANYVSAIFAKLQVADRAEAMIRAREAGLGT